MEDLIKTFAVHGALLIGKTLIMAPLTARQRLKNKVPIIIYSKRSWQEI